MEYKFSTWKQKGTLQIRSWWKEAPAAANNITAGLMCLSQDPYVCSSPEGMDGPTPTPSPKCSNSNKAQFVYLGASADHEYL
jgi:hypothetical protein